MFVRATDDGGKRRHPGWDGGGRVRGRRRGEEVHRPTTRRERQHRGLHNGSATAGEVLLFNDVGRLSYVDVEKCVRAEVRNQVCCFCAWTLCMIRYKPWRVSNKVVRTSGTKDSKKL